MKRIALFAALLVAAGCAFAQAGKVEVQWLGQAAFRITTPGGKVIVTDPWLLKNPITPPEYKKLEALGKVDLLLVTHGHWDHIADAPALARLNNIPMWGPGDLNMALTTLGVLPPAQLPRFNKSGRIAPLPGIKVTAVHAEHSSVYVWNNPATGKDETHPGGEPVGYIIELENGFRIYHMGDTGVFGDMKFIAEYYKPDLVLMPIGGHFTMDPADAAYATRELM
ncbi:MAG: metal-dependent hydrolase, partial [Proteobacteria bacterium]|nr:metal-dependent hydrolase [Pseudomonadota bacterium]